MCIYVYAASSPVPCQVAAHAAVEKRKMGRPPPPLLITSTLPFLRSTLLAARCPPGPTRRNSCF